MRIVSLLPSATEIVCLLGLGDKLVGRSHACDFPLDVAKVPVMTFDSFDSFDTVGTGRVVGATNAEIDARVSQRIHEGLSLYGLHNDRLEHAKPDLILTQRNLCAVSYDTVKGAVRELNGSWTHEAHIVSLEPTTMDGIFETIVTIGELTNTAAMAKAQVQALRNRLDRVREAVASVVHRPTVAALEWLDPPYASGYWVPEQIEIAGGYSVLGTPGKPSMGITWDDVIATQAEMVVAMPCDYDLAGSVRQFLGVAGNEVWRDLPATYLWQLYAVDATSFFSRPGPRVVAGAEVLAGMIHPNRWPAPGPEQALRVNDVVQATLRLT